MLLCDTPEIAVCVHRVTEKQTIRIEVGNMVYGKRQFSRSRITDFEWKKRKDKNANMNPQHSASNIAIILNTRTNTTHEHTDTLRSHSMYSIHFQHKICQTKYKDNIIRFQ